MIAPVISQPQPLRWNKQTSVLPSEEKNAACGAPECLSTGSSRAPVFSHLGLTAELRIYRGGYRYGHYAWGGISFFEFLLDLREGHFLRHLSSALPRAEQLSAGTASRRTKRPHSGDRASIELGAVSIS